MSRRVELPMTLQGFFALLKANPGPKTPRKAKAIVGHPRAIFQRDEVDR